MTKHSMTEEFCKMSHFFHRKCIKQAQGKLVKKSGKDLKR